MTHYKPAFCEAYNILYFSFTEEGPQKNHHNKRPDMKIFRFYGTQYKGNLKVDNYILVP